MEIIFFPVFYKMTFTLGPLCFGDCKQSTEVSVDITAVTQQISNSIQTQTQTIKSNVVLNQNQNVAITGSCCDDIIISQQMTIDTVDITKMGATQLNNISTTISNALNNAIDSAQDNKTGFFGSPLGNDMKSKLKQTISNITQSDSFKQTIMEKLSNTFGNQGQNIKIDCGVYSPPPAVSDVPGQRKVCNISQDFLYKNVSNNILDSLFSEINTSTVGNELKSLTQTKSSNVSGGLEDVIGSLSKWVLYIVIGIVCIVAAVFVFGKTENIKAVAELTPAGRAAAATKSFGNTVARLFSPTKSRRKKWF